MEELDIPSVAAPIDAALRRKVDALPEDAPANTYALLLAQIRALHALASRLRSIEQELATKPDDATLKGERSRALKAMAQLTQEMAR